MVPQDVQVFDPSGEGSLRPVMEEMEVRNVRFLSWVLCSGPPPVVRRASGDVCGAGPAGVWLPLLACYTLQPSVLFRC